MRSLLVYIDGIKEPMVFHADDGFNVNKVAKKIKRAMFWHSEVLIKCEDGGIVLNGPAIKYLEYGL